MVDLDQCAHATINGCDKERRGWCPHPRSFSPSICLPSCPARCPPAQLFLSCACSSASTPTWRQALCWFLRSCWRQMRRPPPSTCSLRAPRSLLSGDHCFISGSLLNLSHSVFSSYTGSGCISHVHLPAAPLILFSRAGSFLLLTFYALLECTIYNVLTIL